MTTAAAQTQAESHSIYDMDTTMLVTMRVDKQLFGLPVKHVQDVLKEQKWRPSRSPRRK